VSDIASYAEAAAALDAEFKMKPCSFFTQLLKARGSTAVGSNTSSGQAAGSSGQAGGRKRRASTAKEKAGKKRGK
jgi:hypothetical protein